MRFDKGIGKSMAPGLAALHLVVTVPVDEAHIVVGTDKKIEYSSRDTAIRIEEKTDPATGNKTFQEVAMEGERTHIYFRTPWVTKVQKVPLGNLRVEVDEMKLDDINFAKFACEVVCFARVIDPILAAERTNISEEKEKYEGYKVKLSADFNAILASIARTAATKQTIVDIFKDREKLQKAVEGDVGSVLPRWGLKLVNLEIMDIKDVAGSTIIQDIERKQASIIKAAADVTVAEQDKIARIAKATNDKDAKLTEAESQEIAQKRIIEKDEGIGKREQQKDQAIAEAQVLANEKTVDAARVTAVNTAEYNKTVTITNAEAQKQKTIKDAEAAAEKLKIEATGEASKIEQTGKAEASIIQIKGEADGAAIKARKVGEAEGIQKMGEALKANESAILPKAIDAAVQIATVQAEAASKALANAHINVITGDSENLVNGGLFGTVAVGPKQGVALAQALQGAGLTDEGKELIKEIVREPSKLPELINQLAKAVPKEKTEQAKSKTT
jgi:uncharacterized membrane protein YqiK